MRARREFASQFYWLKKTVQRLSVQNSIVTDTEYCCPSKLHLKTSTSTRQNSNAGQAHSYARSIMPILPVPVCTRLIRLPTDGSHFLLTLQLSLFFKRLCLVEGQVVRCRHGYHRMSLQEAASRHHFSGLQSNSDSHHTQAVGCTEEESLGCIALAEVVGYCSSGCTGLDRVRREVGQSTRCRTWVVDPACVGVER